MSKQKYTEQEYKKAYAQIKKILLEQKNEEKHPNATLVGGQPGSGKSQLTNFLLSQDKNIINIDGDYIRQFHPNLESISHQYGQDYPKITQPFVNRTVEQLIDELSKEKYNLIIEGTLRDINIPIRTATMLEERDYLVELYVVATNKNLSWQSTVDRGDKMKEDGEVPRYVDKELHDRIADSLPTNVKLLSESDMFYNVVIIRRDQTVIYDKNESPELDPEQILESEISDQPILREEITKEIEESRSVEELLEAAKDELHKSETEHGINVMDDWER